MRRRHKAQELAALHMLEPEPTTARPMARDGMKPPCSALERHGHPVAAECSAHQPLLSWSEQLAVGSHPERGIDKRAAGWGARVAVGAREPRWIGRLTHATPTTRSTPAATSRRAAAATHRRPPHASKSPPRARQ
eukprot:scaffold164864_cov29-Tisochrysis_lutea.AAC.4